MGIIIRRIEERDNRSIADVIKNVCREFKVDWPGTVYTDPTTNDLYRLFQNPGSAYWIAEEDGRLVGGCGIYPTDGLPANYAELVKFYLLPGSRGKGIGKKLMAKCFISAIASGYEHLYLKSIPEFDKALEMYEKAGFKQLESALGHSVDLVCNIWMVKPL